MSKFVVAAASNRVASRIGAATIAGGFRRSGGSAKPVAGRNKRVRSIVFSAAGTVAGTETMRALITVFDKRGVGEFAQALEEMGVAIVSTGGTAKKLEEQGIAVTRVEDLTGFPEIVSFSKVWRNIFFFLHALVDLKADPQILGKSTICVERLFISCSRIQYQREVGLDRVSYRPSELPVIALPFANEEE